MYHIFIKNTINFNPRSHEGSDCIGSCICVPYGHFNPRSHEGSDNRLSLGAQEIADFNPRSHEGSDYSQDSNPLQPQEISIHAPTKGATGLERCMDRIIYNFNPRSHEGSDISSYPPMLNSQHFNPRSHEGSDGYLYQPGNVPLISIHAPTKGATYKNVRSELQSSISIHAPTKGATSFRASLKGTEWISIHAPTKGATTAELFSP